MGHSPSIVYNKEFLAEFSEFLADCASRYDQILLLGDFNIHVCCPGKLLWIFLDLVNCFNFAQSVNGATQKCGHTLDLVLSYGLLVMCMLRTLYSLTTCLFYVIIFLLILLLNRLLLFVVIVLLSQILLSGFPCCIIKSCPILLFLSTLDDLLSYFDSACKCVLDVVAPLRLRQCPRLVPSPQS